jgi:hypothetical protein
MICTTGRQIALCLVSYGDTICIPYLRHDGDDRKLCSGTWIAAQAEKGEGVIRTID